jgi:hypothetical protein
MILTITESINNIVQIVEGGLSIDIADFDAGAGAVQGELLSAKGSMISASGPSTPVEVPIGADNTVLTADSSSSRGVSWKDSAGGGSSLTLTNYSSINLAVGMIGVIDTSHDNGIKTTTRVNDRTVLGIAKASTAPGISGVFYFAGQQTVAVYGNATVGHYLVTSSYEGYAQDSGSTSKPQTGCIGMCLSSYTGGGIGTVSALLMISPDASVSNVRKEAFWTNTGTGTAVTCSIAPVSVPNSYIVACVELDGSSSTTGSITVPKIDTTNMTIVSTTSTTFQPRVLIAVLAASSGASFTCTVPYSGTWRVTIYQFSGVDQSNPYVAATPFAGTTATASVTLATYANGITVDVIGANGTTSGASGQTIAYANCSGYLSTTTSYTATVSYTFTSTSSSLAAISLKPA